MVRIISEVLFILILWLMLTYGGFTPSLIINLIISFVVIHSISWFLVGNFWVYMLDSFKWVKNPGIDSVFRYIDFVRRVFMYKDSVKAILIYGSMCRHAFHKRSDLDLRVIRRSGIQSGILTILVGFWVRSLAFFKKIPLDLQVVDSECFLERQMRGDELPIVVYLRPNTKLNRKGLDFQTVKMKPDIVLRAPGGS